MSPKWTIARGRPRGNSCRREVDVVLCIHWLVWFSGMTNRWVSFSFFKGLYVIRGKDSAKEKKICSFIRLELMRCQGDSLQRCWLFLKDNWETLLFSELGGWFQHMHKFGSPYEQKWDHTVDAGRVSESAVIHAVSYYQQQFASGLVPVSTHVSILHKGPECNILWISGI